MNEKIIFIISLVILIAIIISYRIYNIQKIHLEPFFIFILILLSFFYLSSRFLIWIIYTKKLKENEWFKNFLISEIYFGLQFIPAFIGSYLFIINLPELKSEIKKYASSITISAGIGSILGLALLASIFAIVVAPNFVIYVLALFGIIYIASSLFGTKIFWKKFRKYLSKIPNKTIKQQIKSLIKTRAFLRQKDIWIVTTAYLPSYLFEGFIFVFSFISLGLHPPLLLMLFIFYFADAIGLLFGTPGAIGSFDIIAITLSSALAGIPGVASIVAILIFRVFNLLEPAIIAYLSYYVYSKLYASKQSV